MNAVHQTLIENPHASVAISVLGSALLDRMQERYPALAAEFACVFSYATEAGPVSIAAVGAALHIDVVRDGELLVVRLRRDGQIERTDSHRLD